MGDPVLDIEDLRTAGTMWASDLHPSDPIVGPLFGPIRERPPTAIDTRSLDVLSPDVIRLRQRALSEGAAPSFELRKYLIHNWAMPSSPEGKAVRSQNYRQLGLAHQ